MDIITILKIITALGIFNVWILRYNKATKFRGGQAKNLKEELLDLSTKDELKKVNTIINDLEGELKNDNRKKIKELIKLLDLATQSFSEKRIKKSIKSALVGKNYDNLL